MGMCLDISSGSCKANRVLQMTRSRQSNRDSLQGSESSEEESDERLSPRGRSAGGKENFKPDEENERDVENERDEVQVDKQIDAAMAENSKKSGQ